MIAHDSSGHAVDIPGLDVAAAPRGLALRAILAALAAGLLAWLAGESAALWVAPVKVPQVVMGQPFRASTIKTEQTAAIATAVRQYAAFGALLGLALGAVGGPVRHAVSGALLGLALGAAAGACASFVGVPVFFRVRYSFFDEVIPSFLLHGAIFSAIGGAAGLAFGIATGRRGGGLARAFLGGVLGALLGTAAYEIITSVLFANSDGGEPIPGSPATRMLARLLVATSTAAGVLAASSARRRASSQPG
jgi:hypothetical protein